MIGNFLFHPTEDRRLTPSELKAICGVPDSFQLAGPSPHWASLLARGVMPAVASWLAESVKNTLYYPDCRWEDRRVTLIDLRTPGVDPVDLTSRYLDANGRVRFRVHADGSITSSPLIPSPGTVTAIPAKPYKVPQVTWAEFPIGDDGTPEPTSVRLAPPEGHDNSSFIELQREDVRVQQLPEGHYLGTSEKVPGLTVECDTVEETINAAQGVAQDLIEEARYNSNSNPPDCLSAHRGHGGSKRGEMGVHGSQPNPSDVVEAVSLRPFAGEGSAGTAPQVGYTDPFFMSVRFKPAPGEGSGLFMQRLWRTTALSPDEIVALVHANWQGRTTKRSDMYYNYKKLVDAGEAVRPWSVERASQKIDTRHLTSREQKVMDEALRRSFRIIEPIANPAEDRVGPDDTGEGESQTLSADVGPVATSRFSAGASEPPLTRIAREYIESGGMDSPFSADMVFGRKAEKTSKLPKTFKDLAFRSDVVPENGPPVDVALVYLSALPTPEEKANPVSSVRMAWFLKEELRPDVVWSQNDYPREVIPGRIGELWVVNSSWTFMKDDWRRISMCLFDRADRIVFCQNDYTMYLHSYHMGRIREDANYVVLSTCKDVPLHVKHGHKALLVNWNALTYIPRPENDADRKCGVYYYGSFRQGRQGVFNRYFGNEGAEAITVSASTGKEVKKFQNAYPRVNVVPRSENVFNELERWRATLMLEDERSTKIYVSPPNRFYEALSSRCPMIFDTSSEAMFRRYGYDISDFVVESPWGLKRIIDHDFSDQSAWQRDHVGETRAQLHEAIDMVRKGGQGRIGAPPGLKRYTFTEEGGER